MQWINGFFGDRVGGHSWPEAGFAPQIHDSDRRSKTLPIFFCMESEQNGSSAFDRPLADFQVPYA